METGPLSWDNRRTKFLLAAALLFLVGGRAATTEIVVTTEADAVNGDVSRVAALLASPGPDGVSLREVILATNNDPGSYSIRFAGPLTVLVRSPMPPLMGGNVAIQGPATIRAIGAELLGSAAFQLSSSGNRLVGLTIEDFSIGIDIRPFNVPVPVGVTYADNVIDGLTIRGVRTGVLLTFYSLTCDSPCPTHNSWVNTTITRNTIEASQDAIHVPLMNVVGDRVEGLRITDNTIRLGTAAAPGLGGPAIQTDIGGNSTDTRIANVLIARNTIETFQADGDGAITVAAGLQRAHGNTIENVRILDNQVHVRRPSASVPCCFGIMITAGSDFFAFAIDPRITGDTYPDGNLIRNVQITGNSVRGALASAVRIQAGADGGGSRNRVERVRVQRNVTRSTILGKGVYLWVGQTSPGKGSRPATGNSIADVAIDGNRITTGKGRPTVDTDQRTAGGVVLLGGELLGRDGSIRGVRITNNQIATAQAGIRVIGGRSDARGNSVSCVRIARNRITGTRIAVSVKANIAGARRNRATLAC